MHRQKTVSTYLYPLYVPQDTKPTVICNTRRYKTKTQYLNVNLDCLIWHIGHSLFDIHREVGYLLDVRNIGHSKCRNKHILPFALTLYKVKKIQNQNAVYECENALLKLDIRYLTFAVKLATTKI